MKIIIRSRNGTTMVEVIVAFTVLVLVMGIFSQAMVMAGRLMNRADRVLEDSRELARDYYLDKGSLDMAKVGDGLTFRLSGYSAQKSRQSFSVPAKLRKFTKGEETIYDVTVP